MKKLAILLAVLAFALSARPSSAHATLVRADPPPNSVLSQSPASLSLWFDETLDPRFSALSLLDPAQNRLDLKNVHYSDDRKQQAIGVSPDLPPGAYTVSWRAVSAVDGHITNGVYAIFVGVPAAGRAPLNTNETGVLPLPLDIALRWLNLLAALALCGALTLRLLMSDASEAFAAARAHGARRLRGWVVLALLVLLVGTLVTQLLQTAAAAELSVGDVLAQSVWLNTLTSTRYGQAALARIVCVDGLLILFVMKPEPEPWRIRRLWNVPALDLLYVALSMLILLTFSAASHAAASTDPLGLATLMDWLHLLAVGVWTGGLFALGVVVTPTSEQTAGTSSTLLVILRRFSRVAVAAVVLFSVTGIYGLWRQVGYVSALGTAYGETLLLKMLLVVPLVVIGAMNALLLRPYAGRWVTGRMAAQKVLRLLLSTQHLPARHAAQKVLRYARIETALGAVVVLAAATLTALPPARTVASALPPLDPAAMLAKSDAAMNQLQTMSEVQRLAGDTGLVVTATFHFVAPDKLQFITSTGLSSIAIGDSQYYLEAGKGWEKVQRAEPLRWPQFTYARDAREAQFEGEELVDGELCAIVKFKAQNVDYFRHWIGERSGLLRKQQMEAPGHHMLSTFAQFDETFKIEAPGEE